MAISSGNCLWELAVGIICGNVLCDVSVGVLCGHFLWELSVGIVCVDLCGNFCDMFSGLSVGV